MKPLSSRRRSGQTPTGCLIPFFGVFLVAGLAVSYFILWKPWSTWIAARFWEEVPCRIVSSQVTESSDSDGGSTYKVDITWVSKSTAGGYVRNVPSSEEAQKTARKLGVEQASCRSAR